MIHTVERGQIISDVADIYGTTVEAICSLNPEIENPDMTYEGQIVQIPDQEDPHNGENDGLDEQERDALRIHNEARERISNNTGCGRPALIWDRDLSNACRDYAQYLADNNMFEHSQGDYGENLGIGYDTMAAAVEAWLGEEPNYGGQGIDEGFMAYGHFTACIWPHSTHVGIGIVEGPNGNVVVARYTPAGNMSGVSAYTGE